MERIGVLLGDLVGLRLGPRSAVLKSPVLPHCREQLASHARNRYGFVPELDWEPSVRVEFSLHPVRRGVRHTHTIIWQFEEVGAPRSNRRVFWPNRFSQFIGDKAFGLLVAHLLGAPVVPRRQSSLGGYLRFSLARLPEPQKPGSGRVPPFSNLASSLPPRKVESVRAHGSRGS